MQKHLLLNIAGVAVLSLMCACGPQKEESKEETKKEALAEVPASVQTAANEALAQAEAPAPEDELPPRTEEGMPGEEKTNKVAAMEPTTEPAEQKA